MQILDLTHYHRIMEEKSRWMDMQYHQMMLYMDTPKGIEGVISYLKLRQEMLERAGAGIE